MNKIIYCLVILCSISAFNKILGQESASVDKILKQTIEVLKEVESKIDLPKPKNINITFETSVSTEKGVGIKILIFKFGRKWQREQSNEITYKFEINPNRSIGSEQIKMALTKAIKEAYEQLAKVNSGNAKVKGFTVKVSFVIEKSTTVDGEYELVPITNSLGKS